MIGPADVSEVRRNVLIPSGTCGTMPAISDSSIGPGPLGIFETKPSAVAPLDTASSISARLAMQQIFILSSYILCSVCLTQWLARGKVMRTFLQYHQTGKARH
jgi:hypothetical protein